ADDVAVDVDIPCRKALDDVPDGGVDPGLNAEGKPIAGGCEVVDETVELLGAIAHHMQHRTKYFLPQIGRALQLDNSGWYVVARSRQFVGHVLAKQLLAKQLLAKQDAVLGLHASDPAVELVLRRRIDNRSHMGSRIAWIADPELPRGARDH